jgi:prepilin-type N-terminal cleavage/methylation domain-containing protein
VSRGFTVPEVLVTLLLSSLLVVALGRVLGTVTRTLQLRDSQAEMRERARFAMATLEADIQMAGYYGLTARGGDFRWLQSGNSEGAIASAALAQTAPALSAAPAAAHECGVNFVLDLATPLQADNNRFALGRNRSAGCAPNGGARAGTDTLTLRRASTLRASPDPGRFQLLVDRSDERRRWILADGTAPTDTTMTADRVEWHDLLVNSYYISNDSVGMPGMPALRVKSLTRISGRPALVDTEVMPGIEDLQLQWVTDSGVYEPDSLPATERIRMVQLWLRVRATTSEPGYRDTQSYRYANVVAIPGATEQSFRRMLISRRFALRNAAP